MKKIFGLYPYLILLLSSSLEIYYYYFRFSQEGVNIYVSILIATFLTFFLTLLTAYYYKKFTWFIIIPLFIYSIAVTSAGQNFSLGVTEEKQTINQSQELNRQDEINELQKEIRYLDTEFENISPQIVVADIAERYKYEGVIRRAQTRQDEIRTEKKELQEKISGLRIQQTTHSEVEIKTTDVYKFYGNLFSINQNWLKFILQTILSFFIAAGSPFAIILITSKKPPSQTTVNQPDPTPPQSDKITDEQITLFVNLTWSWFTHDPKKNMIVPFRLFEKAMENRELQKKKDPKISKEQFTVMFNQLLKDNFIDKAGFIIYNGKISTVIELLKKKIKR